MSTTGLDSDLPENSARLSDYLVREATIADLEATTKEGAIREVIGRLVDVGSVPAPELERLIKSLLDREELGSTGIGRGVAVPHTRYFSKLDRGVVAIARSWQGIEFNALDGEPVHLLFVAICAPRDSHSLMFVLGDFLRENRSLDELITAPSHQRFLELLEWAARGAPGQADGPD